MAALAHVSPHQRTIQDNECYVQHATDRLGAAVIAKRNTQHSEIGIPVLRTWCACSLLSHGAT